MKTFGIERHTFLLILIPILVMVVLMKSHDIYTRFDDMDKAMLDRSRLLARQLASSSEYAVFSGNKVLLQKEVEAAFLQRGVVSVAIFDQNNAVLAGGGTAQLSPFDRVGAQNHLYQDSDKLLLYEPIMATQIDFEGLDQDIDRTALPAMPSRELGAVVVQISKSYLNHEKNIVLLFSGIATLLILIITSLVAIWASRRISRPIMEMTGVVRQIGRGNLDTRVPISSGIDELKDLAEGINQMASQLEFDRDAWQNRLAEATRELRQKKEEAEHANRDKSRFLAAASHDLRQPIHALGLFIGQLHGKASSPEQVRIVRQIEESTEAFSNLLNGLLDISKLDAGIVLPQIQAVPVSTLLIRMAQEYEPVARDHGIRFRVRPIALEVVSDPILLERILSNLISNALRYTPHSGHVLVGCRRHGDRLNIEVWDNGMGISEVDQKNIFREFFQLGNKERDRNKGLGLGLAIVERLVKLLGCELILRSHEGRGSMFAVEVPLYMHSKYPAKYSMGGDYPVSQAEEQGSGMHVDLCGIRVLLVDDDILVRTSTEGMLKEWGCKVCSAASKQDACENYRGVHFDLLICDYRLPDGTGLETIAWIEHMSQRVIPSILITGDTATEILQEISGHRCRLLHKPVRPAKLRSLALYLLTEGTDEIAETGLFR